jgi:hypothetical protein
MGRVLVGLAALATWVVGSGFLFALAALSVWGTLINGSLAVVGTSLVGSAIALALKRDGLAVALSAAPALAACGILLTVYLLNYSV